MSLEKAYLDIKTKIGKKFEIDSLRVVKSVNAHRNFWKPNKVKTLLLAESHLYTSITKYDNIMRYDGFPELVGCPTNYVKLVYCLGYGESKLVNLTDPGTPPYWKIFVSCVNQNFNSEFGKILIKDTPNFHQRLRNKISLLEKLKEKGIWLVDASIVALYKDKSKPTRKIRKEITKISWEHHVSKVIHEAKPDKIIVIGICVSEDLEDELKKTHIDFDVQRQPNSRLSTKELEKTHERYYELCNS